MNDEMRVLVVYDGRRGPTATQTISFGQPFESSPPASSVRIDFAKDHEDAAELSRSFVEHRPDLLVLSRYTSDRGSRWEGLARHAGIPVIFHIDDDLLAVPSSLGSVKHSAYNNPERLAALRENIERSDLLYVSTPALAERFREHGISTPIVAGQIYCSVSPEEIGALVGPATGPVIGYMGTGGHSADVAMIIPALCEVMETIPSLQLEFFGTIKMPDELASFGRRARHLPPVPNYADFIPSLRSLGWWVGLAPLEDNAFNRCKADTKWVEYSLAGTAVVASNLPVYERACSAGAGILARSHEDWTRAIRSLVLNPSLRARTIASAQGKLREEYTHDALRRQVMAVFDRAFALRRDGGSATRPPRELASAGGLPPRER